MLIPIFIIVGISISTALILDHVEALHNNFFSLYTFLGILFVLALNALKFFVWYFLHKKFELSSTFPLTAIYFPLIYIISVLKNEMVVDLYSLIAIVLVFFGVYLILSSENTKEDLI